MSKPKLLIVAHTNLGTSLSGGDRIFLNILRYGKDKFSVKLLACQEAINLTRHFKLTPSQSQTACSSKSISLNTMNLVKHHIQRFISGTIYCLKNRGVFKESQYIYTSSDFYGDFVFGVIAKLINPQITWICGYYLLSPSPFDKSSPYNQNKHFERGLIYYLAQVPTVIIAKCLANYVFVTSKPDIKTFLSHRLHPSQIIVIQGGVFIPPLSTITKLAPPKDRKYDAVYIGRLHSQKGVLEIISIWKLLVNKIPDAKLIIIGDGELMTELVSKINDNNLSNNVTIVGFCIGKRKFDIIRNSKIVVHPATYDSGGMAAAEAMAWGLPGVSFDLPALITYYPKGMIKTPCFDHQKFADNIEKLLTNQKFYLEYSSKARQLIVSSWNWKSRLTKIFNKLK